MSFSMLLTLAAVFGAVALTVGGVLSVALSRTAPERRRLQLPRGQSILIENPALAADPPKFIKQLTGILPRSPRDMTKLRRRLARAGHHSLTGVAVITMSQIGGAVFLGTLPLFFVPFARLGWLLMLTGAMLGFVMPGLILDRLIARRQKQIRNGLPDALDLLIVCLEAGSSIDQAILRSSEELAVSYPALAEEFQMIITETRAGKPRLEAFRNFASRTGVDDVRSLVAMLVQTDRFGTSVSQALRTHAETLRTKRRQRAEERAAKIGVKLVFPLVFMLFPAFFTVTLGPAVIRFMRVLFGQVLGQ
jgi:tight adherence protein C